MKKHLHYALYWVLCTFVPFLSLSAAETTLWESTYTSDGVEINSETVASFKAGDILRIYLSVPEGGANFKICYKGAPDWSETTIPSLDSQWPWVNGGEDHFDLTFTQEDITAFSGKNIYIYQGDNSLISKVTLVTEDQDPDPDPEDPETLQPGETKVLWEGSETLAWNEVAEQPASVGALLAEKDQIIVTVGAKGAADWPKVLLRDLSSTQVGEDILLNEVTEFPHEAVFTLSAANVAALKDGFKLCGDGVTVTKMMLKKYEEEEPDPEEPSGEYDFTAVWTGDKAISWNTEVYAGEQFDTYGAQQDMFAGLAKDDSIKVFYADAVEGAQFAASYKAGEDWTWTDLAITEHDGFYAYRVASEEMAQWIADRGIVLRGQGYHAVRIELGKPKSTTGFESIQYSAFSGQKILRNGQVLIIRENAIYNMLGQKIQ